MKEVTYEEYATRECCMTCNNINHFCKEKCECWTFAEFGYSKANEQLLKAKELLTKWVELFKPKGGNIPPTPIQVETEQFIREVTV